MTLADRLNNLEVDATDERGVVSLCPQSPLAFVGDKLKPEFRWVVDCVTYLGRGHSGERHTYYVRRGREVARWDWSGCVWEESC